MDDKVQTSSKTRVDVRLLYRIMRGIQKGMYPTQIARVLRLPKSTVLYHVKNLEKLGLVKRRFRTNFLVFEITEKGLDFMRKVRRGSIPSRKNVEPGTRLHNLVIKFPILKDNPDAKWDSENELRNWVEKYLRVEFPIGLTIKKTTRHVLVYFHQFRTRRSAFLSDFYNWVMKGVILVQQFLMNEKGIVIDVFDGRVVRQHVANESPEFDKHVERGSTAEVKLGRDAVSIFPSDEEARAWLDKSLGLLDIETNDMLYEEKLLMMPEYMHEIARRFLPAVEQYARQIRLHLEVLQGIKQAVEELRTVLKPKGDLAPAKPPEYTL